MKRERKNKAERNAIEITAAEWVIKNDHGLTAEQQDELSEWLSDNPLHREAYFREHRSWEDLDRLVGMHQTYHKPVNPDLLADDEFVRRKGRLHRVAWLAVFPLSAVFVLMALLPLISMDETSPAQVPVADSGEFIDRIQKKRLEDGSVVSLNRGAKILEEFNEEERLVRLFNGEANFNVAKDASRPFVVDVFGVRVKAVGTAFNVRISDEHVNVIVTEGVVSLNSEANSVGDGPEGESFLEANFRAIVSMHDGDRGVEVEALDPKALGEELLWQPVLIDFDDVPLSEIVDEFNRRNPIHIVVRDPNLSSIRLSSIFWSDNVNGFIRLLEGKFGIRAQQGEDNTVYLYHP